MYKRNLYLIYVLISFLMNSAADAGQFPTAKPGDVGMDAKRLSRVRAEIQDAIGHKDFPGAVLLVARKNRIVLHEAFGDCQWVPEVRKMELNMIFDLASITKPVATATSVMKLVEDGRIRLQERVSEYIPQFSVFTDSSGKKSDGARIWHLLTHTSGLPPYTDAKAVEKRYGLPCSTDSLIAYIARLNKINAPGEGFHYSCLGFITLAHIVKQVTGQSIADFSHERIFKPLQMANTFFSPPEPALSRCVPTEVINGKPLIGVVHDPLARLQGGISGNAGLFSSAEDLFIFAQMMLNGGEYEGVRVLSPLTVQRMTTVFPEVLFSGRGLGWDLDSGYSSNGGDLFGPNSYGHTGYTGTSIWIDPDTETVVIFMTNRVHPDDGGAIITLRSKVANIVAGSIVK